MNIAYQLFLSDKTPSQTKSPLGKANTTFAGNFFIAIQPDDKSPHYKIQDENGIPFHLSSPPPSNKMITDSPLHNKPKRKEKHR
jgi:hypothetical protein